ncbi:MAG: hypothetical protein L3J06_02010 [Cyclobacteriaceae bacterium]|nr:hypothetical protein [Cyclobacteriaceae bacterium]
MIISQNKLAITYFNKEDKVLVSVYKGRAVVKLALEHLQSIVGFYEKNEVHGSIVYVKGVYGSYSKILGYMKDFYCPVAIKSGLKCQGFVVSEDLIVNNLSLKIKEMATLFNLKSKVFSERREAEAWVKLRL